MGNMTTLLREKTVPLSIDHIIKARDGLRVEGVA